MRMVAAVLGGGTGQRIGAPLPKQLLQLGGRSLIEHCVAAFERAPGVDDILVVMASGYVGRVREMVAAGGHRKVSAVIAGGASRPESTRVALAAIGRAWPRRVRIRPDAACCCTTRRARWSRSGSSLTA